MPSRKKRPRDFAQRAKMIVDIATGEIEDREPTPEERAIRTRAARARAATNARGLTDHGQVQSTYKPGLRRSGHKLVEGCEVLVEVSEKMK
jgi:hypothetical protein